MKDNIENAEQWKKDFEDKIWRAKYQEDNKVVDFNKHLTKEKIEEVIKEVFQEDNLDNYYKETRYPNGIHIKFKRNGITMDLFGGIGFANEFDKAFDSAMKDSVNKDINK